MNLPRTSACLRVLLLPGIILAAAGCDPRGDADALTPDPLVRRGVLPNGVRYAVRGNAKPAGRVELRLVVRAGSVLEEDDQQGLAHLLEHMAFNGTRNFARQQLVDYLEAIGMRFGPDLNAYTSFDETVYMLQVPVDRPGALDQGLRILSDWAFGILNLDEEIEKERGVVIEEWRLGRGAQQRLRDIHFPVLFTGSRYADRLPIGKKEVLDRFPPARVRDFYRDWYRPELLSVLAVGDADPKDLERRVRAAFAGPKSDPQARPRTEYDMPTHDETLVSIAQDPEATETSAGLYVKRPREILATRADFRRELLSGLFTRMLDERLAEMARRAEAPFLAARCFSGGFIRATSMFGVSADTRHGEALRGLEAAYREAERVRRHGFTTTELERARAHRLAQVDQAWAERFTTESAAHASRLVAERTRDRVVIGIEAERDLTHALLPLVDVADVNALATPWLAHSNRVILVSGPAQAGHAPPTAAEVLAMLARIEAEPLDPYEDDVRDAPLLAELPPAGSVVERETIPELDLTVWLLSNGARVLVKPTAFKRDQVLFTAFSPGGHSLAADAEHIPASSADNVVYECGIGEFSLPQLEKHLAGKVVSLRPHISELQEGLGGASRPDDLETLCALAHLYMTAPRADASAFSAYRDRTRTSLELRLSQPESVFWDAVSTAMSQNHPRRLPWTPETVERMDLDASLAAYRARFADAGDFTFLFVGNVDLEGLEALVSRYLASLPGSANRENWRDLGIRPPTGPVAREVLQGLEPKSRVHLVFSNAIDWTFAERHRVQSMMEVLRLRLRETIREEIGGSYHVEAHADLEPYPEPQCLLRISFGCAPEQVERLIGAVHDEIRKLRDAPPTATDVEKVQAMQRREREVNLEKNEFWLSVLRFYAWNREDPRTLLQFDALVDALSPEGIQTTANRYFATPNVATFVLRPEDPSAK